MKFVYAFPILSSEYLYIWFTQDKKNISVFFICYYKIHLFWKRCHTEFRKDLLFDIFTWFLGLLRIAQTGLNATCDYNDDHFSANQSHIVSSTGMHDDIMYVYIYMYVWMYVYDNIHYVYKILLFLFSSKPLLLLLLLVRSTCAHYGQSEKKKIIWEYQQPPSLIEYLLCLF